MKPLNKIIISADFIWLPKKFADNLTRVDIYTYLFLYNNLFAIKLAWLLKMIFITWNIKQKCQTNFNCKILLDFSTLLY